MNIGLVILAVYIAVLLGIALYASKKDKKNIKDFATGGGLGIFILTLTFSATYHSAYAFMGAGGFAYKNGIGWWCNGLWTVLPGVLFWVWGRRFWYLGKRYGYLSVSDYASDVYQSKTVGILVTLITMIFTIPYVAIQAIGCSYIFQTISGGMLSYTVGALIFFAIMIVLVWPSPTPLKGYLCSPAYSAVRFGLSLQISHPLQMPTKQRSLIRRNSSQCRGQTAS